MPDRDRPVVFLDTNIWLYAFIRGQDPVRHRHAQTVLQQCVPVVSPQVINEVCVNLLRKAQFTESQLHALIVAFYEKYLVMPLDQTVLLGASGLRLRYALSYWDSLIVSSALHSPATVLYSEDMQPNLLIDHRLQIVNSIASAFSAACCGVSERASNLFSSLLRRVSLLSKMPRQLAAGSFTPFVTRS